MLHTGGQTVPIWLPVIFIARNAYIRRKYLSTTTKVGIYNRSSSNVSGIFFSMIYPMWLTNCDCNIILNLNKSLKCNRKILGIWIKAIITISDMCTEFVRKILRSYIALDTVFYESGGKMDGCHPMVSGGRQSAAPPGNVYGGSGRVVGVGA